MAAELSYGAYYQPSTGKFSNKAPEIVGVTDRDNKPYYGNPQDGWEEVDPDNDPQFREYYSWTPTPFANRPLTIALNRAADQANFISPYRGQVLQMLEAYAPILQLNAQTDFKSLFTNTQNQQYRTYGNWSTYDNPTQTFQKILGWNNLPNNKEVLQYVESTPEYKKESQIFANAWNESNKSSGSFFDDILTIASIAVAIAFPELAGFIGEAMGAGAAASASAIAVGNAVMAGGMAAIQGKSVNEILVSSALGGLGGVSGDAGFLQSLMDAGVPWEVVQNMPKFGAGSLTGAVTNALQGKDFLSGAITGGALSVLGASVSTALTSSGVPALAATTAARAINQLVMNGDIDFESLVKNASLGIVDSKVAKILQEADVPAAAMPTAINAFNQVLTTGNVDPKSLALAATGQFASTAVKDLKNELAGGLPGPTQGETTPVPAPEVVPSTPLAPEAPAVTPTETQTAETPKSGLEQATETAAPAVTQPVAPDGGLTQVATGPTMTDVPVRELNWGDPGYVYPDGTVEGEVKSGLDAVTTTPIPAPEVVPSAPLAPEPAGGLPVDQTLQDAYVNPQTPTKEVTLLPVTPPSGDALLDQYVNPQTVTPEVTQQPVNGLPSTPVVDEGYDPLPDFISPTPIITPATGTEGSLDSGPGGAGLNAPSGGLTPDPTIFPSSVPDPSYNPSTVDQQINDALVSQDSLVLVPVQNADGSVDYVYMDKDTGDVASNPDQVVTDPYFTTNPPVTDSDFGGNAGSSSGGGGGGGGGGLPSATAAPAASTPYSFPVVGGLPTDPVAAKNAMDSTTGATNTASSDPSRRAYLSPVVLSTQGGGKAHPTYAQLIPQLASLLSQRGYADGGQVNTNTNPSLRAYLAPVVANTQVTGRARPTYSQLIPQVASILDQRGYADGGQVDDYFAQILAQRGYPVEMVPGPEDRMYRRHMKRGFAVNGPGTGQSDDIPTMLADGEYVIDADTVAQLGDGSSKAGAQVLDKFREEIRKHKRSAPVDKIPPKAKSPLEYLKAAQKGKRNG